MEWEIGECKLAIPVVICVIVIHIDFTLCSTLLKREREKGAGCRKMHIKINTVQVENLQLRQSVLSEYKISSFLDTHVTCLSKHTIRVKGSLTISMADLLPLIFRGTIVPPLWKAGIWKQTRMILRQDHLTPLLLHTFWGHNIFTILKLSIQDV